MHNIILSDKMLHPSFTITTIHHLYSVYSPTMHPVNVPEGSHDKPPIYIRNCSTQPSGLVS